MTVHWIMPIRSIIRRRHWRWRNFFDIDQNLRWDSDVLEKQAGCRPLCQRPQACKRRSIRSQWSYARPLALRAKWALSLDGMTLALPLLPQRGLPFRARHRPCSVLRPRWWGSSLHPPFRGVEGNCQAARAPPVPAPPREENGGKTKG